MASLQRYDSNGFGLLLGEEPTMFTGRSKSDVICFSGDDADSRSSVQMSFSRIGDVFKRVVSGFDIGMLWLTRRGHDPLDRDVLLNDSQALVDGMVILPAAPSSYNDTAASLRTANDNAVNLEGVLPLPLVEQQPVCDVTTRYRDVCLHDAMEDNSTADAGNTVS